MAIRFRPVERDQEFLPPPNMTDWLGADHVVWFLLDWLDVLGSALGSGRVDPGKSIILAAPERA